MQKPTIKIIIGVIFFALIIFVKREYPVPSTAEINLKPSAAASPLLSGETPLPGPEENPITNDIKNPSFNGESGPGGLKNSDVPKVTAASMLLADIKDGSVYLKKEPGRRWPLASLSKLMTAEVAIDVIDQKSEVVFRQTSAESRDQTTGKATSSDSRYSAADMMKTMLVGSVNEAAESLADFYGRARFMDLMNKKAAALNMKDTYFDDPSGLSTANQSTADDILLLARDIYENYPEIFAITRNPNIKITELVKNGKQTVKSTNIFAGKPEFLGGKTGFTDQANGNLLSVFSLAGRPVFVLVLGSDDRFGETTKLFDWFRNSYKL